MSREEQIAKLASFEAELTELRCLKDDFYLSDREQAKYQELSEAVEVLKAYLYGATIHLGNTLCPKCHTISDKYGTWDSTTENWVITEIDCPVCNEVPF